MSIRSGLRLSWGITHFSGFFASPLPEWLILLLALVVRSWQLNYHSFWFDEAVTLQWASSNPLWTWQHTFSLEADKHPPAYYLLMHLWLELLAPLDLRGNDAAVRWLGSLLGVATVLGMLLLVRRVSGRPIALLSSFLVACSPVLVWYSQELRMFQPATTALVWGGYTLLRGWQGATARQRLGWWVACLLLLTWALYSYLFSALLMPTVGLTLLLLAVVDRRSDWLRRFSEGALTLLATGLLFLPLALSAWSVSSSESEPGQAFADFGANLWRQLRIFTIWRVDWPSWLITDVLIFFAAFALIGLAWPRRFAQQSNVKGGQFDQAWLLLWIGVPFLIGNVLLARMSTVFAEDRYFLFLTPWVLWAVARGIFVCGQRWPAITWSSAGVAGATVLLALPHLWTPAMYREHWRAAADYIATYEQNSPTLPAAVVAHVDYVRRPLERYLRPQISTDELPVFFPFGGPLDPAQVETTIAPPLQGIIDQGTATLWLVQSHLDGVDDQRLVENWLQARFPLVTEQFPAGIQIRGFALRSHFTELPPLPETANLLEQELAPGLQLAACEIITPRIAARDEQLHPPSGWVHIRLWWRATDSIAEDYQPIAQMIGLEGVWGDRLYRANETLQRWPTSSWSIGEVIRDEIDINVNPVTPAGHYPVWISLMNNSGQVLEAKVQCGNVEIIKE